MVQENTNAVCVTAAGALPLAFKNPVPSPLIRFFCQDHPIAIHDAGKVGVEFGARRLSHRFG
jgi:hypothetical protein